MPELSEHDIVQLYADSVCMYDGHPVKVMEAGRNMRILNLEHGKESTVKFEYDKFKSLKTRLGFVNSDGYVFYAARRPARRFSVGITRSNTVIQYVGPQPQYYRHFRGAQEIITRMQSKDWHNTITGKYPSLQLAAKIAANTKGCCAFDRQFAIDKERNVYYKMERVGILPKLARSTNRITFDEGKEHLELLLNPNYDKTVRTFS